MFAFGDGPTYFRDVKPILDKHCVVCHNAASINDADSSGGLSLETADDLLKSSKTSLVISERPAKSELYRRIVHSDPGKRMPKDDAALPDELAITIRRWIESGAAIGTPPVAKSSQRQRKKSANLVLKFPVDFGKQSSSTMGQPVGKANLNAAIGPLAPVTALAHSVDGRYLAVGSRQRVAIWNCKTGRLENSLSERLPDVMSLSFSPDSKVLWMAGGEPAVRGVVRGVEIGIWKRTYDWHAGRDVVAALAVDPKGERVAFVGYDRFLRIVDAKTGEMLHEVKAHGDAVFAAAFAFDGKSIVTGGKDATVKLWDVATGKAVRTFSGHAKDVLAVTFNPTGDRIYSTGLEPELRVWETARVAKPDVKNGPTGTTNQFAWNQQRDLFATVGGNQRIRIWSADAQSRKVLQDAPDVLYAASIAPNGKTIAAAGWDGVVRIWNLESGKIVASLIATDGDTIGATAWLAFTESGGIVASPTLRGRLRISNQGREISLETIAARLEQIAAFPALLTGESPTTVPQKRS